MSENKQHPYAEILRAIADGKGIQVNRGGAWVNVCSDVVLEDISSGLCKQCDYRIKPKTIRIGEYDVPEPLRVNPKFGDEYFVVETADNCSYYASTWTGADCEKRWIARGLIHLTQEAAELHAKALISLTAQK